jgi:hypothetical protein
VSYRRTRTHKSSRSRLHHYVKKMEIVECKDGVCVIRRKVVSTTDNSILDVNKSKGKVDQVGQMGSEASALLAVRQLNRFRVAVATRDSVAGIKASSEIKMHADRSKVDAGINAEFKVNKLGKIGVEFSNDDAFVGSWNVDSQWIPEHSSASLK